MTDSTETTASHNKDTYFKDTFTACQRAFMFVMVFSFVVNVLMLTVPLYMLQIFDRVLASHSYETLIYLTIIAIVALAVFSLIDMTRARVLVAISQWLNDRLSPTALSRSADELLQGRSYGSQSLRDIMTIRQFLGGSGVLAFFDTPWTPLFLFVIFLLYPPLGTIALVGAIIIFSLALINEIATRNLLADANTLAMVNQKQTDAAIRNAEAIQAMGMMPAIVRNWQKSNNQVLQLQNRASHRSSMILSTSKFIRLTLQLLMFGVGAFFVIQSQITTGVMMACAILTSRALAPVEHALGTWRQLIGARQAYQRLKEHFTTPDPRTANLPLPEPQGALRVEKVSYAPLGMEKPILNNVSFEIQPGEMLGVIGPSGAGKTTLARLIVGAWNTNKGKVRLDNADVYSWNREDFGKHVGYLPQDVELFAGTVKENIARMGDIDPDAVITASQLAGVHDMILHFPNGYDTEISTGKFNLSGGQRQRIALARALYKNPCLLVLDEPNANLDNFGEEALRQALVVLNKGGTTIILISHRPNIVQMANKVLILNQGNVQAFGPRETVLAQLQEQVAQQSKK